MELSEYEVLEDMLIGDLKVVQDVRLYRFTSDSVLLSKFAGVKPNDTVADFCSGCGIVAFHFHALHPNDKLSFTLFEKYYSSCKIPYYKMPSTSPANPRFDQRIWREAFNDLR